MFIIFKTVKTNGNLILNNEQSNINNVNNQIQIPDIVQTETQNKPFQNVENQIKTNFPNTFHTFSKITFS